MSDAPTPPASAEPPTPPTDSPRRAHTILGRLSRAVREQTYLRLLAEDMAATSSFLAFGDEWVHAHDRAVTELARAYLADSMARADPYSLIPTGPRRPVPPLDVEALVHDPAFYTAVHEMSVAKAKMRDVRRWITGHSRELNGRIESALNP